MRAIRLTSVCMLLLIGCSGDGNSGNDGAGTGGSSNDDGGPGSGTGRGSSGTGSGSGTSGSGSSGSSGTGSGSAGTAGSASSAQDAGPGATALELCGGPCGCSDGIDNDNDGTIDGFDLECTGPADNDEGSFATGISGDNVDPKWQDCFFDGNSGAGNDGCRYHTECLTGERAATDASCTVTQQCLDFCIARTPSGCDCFGCCTIQQDDGTTVDVVINGDCQEDDLASCQQCVKSADCSNECGECELCPGRGIEDLPESCHATTPPDGGAPTPDGGEPAPDGGVGYRCDNGRQLCAAQSDCPITDYCFLGCCTPVPPD